MYLSKAAEQLLAKLEYLDVLEELNQPELWRRRFDNMSEKSAKRWMDALEELEAEGYIVMSIEERPGKCPIPKRIFLHNQEEDK